MTGGNGFMFTVGIKTLCIQPSSEWLQKTFTQNQMQVKNWDWEVNETHERYKTHLLQNRSVMTCTSS